NEMSKARQNNQPEAYREAYNRYAELSKYKMSESESNRILEKILSEPQEKQLESAVWLYERSPYYSPTLSIDFSINEPGYSYSYTKRLQQQPGKEITLPSASEINIDRSRVGILTGWGLTKDSLTYKGGEKITMPLVNQTLYAIWDSALQLVDSVTDLNITKEGLAAGSKTELPSLTPPDSSYKFLGWYDHTNRTLLDKEQKEYILKGKGALLEALWQSLSVESVSPLYWGFDRLPKKTQLRVGFLLYNQGNASLTNLSAKLSSDSEFVTFINDTLQIREIPAASYMTNNSRYGTKSRTLVGGESNTFIFIIDDKAPEGSVIPFELTLTDNNGSSWSSDVTFKVR
ncbi:MAG: hypothetical protein LHW55_06715, partial [Candidatus Cloacimonetes bacterium]|nr:hypothetical protein [Candidatus Cloacimonadota bacterium]